MFLRQIGASVAARLVIIEVDYHLCQRTDKERPVIDFVQNRFAQSSANVGLQGG